MGFADRYLAQRGEEKVYIPEIPHNDPGIIVTIPAFNESRLNFSLDSLFKCTPARCKTDVLILINWPEIVPENIKKRNLDIFHQTKEWIDVHLSEDIHFHVMMCPDMKAKYAGAGLARKILMDEAVRVFSSISRPDGIIASFDADSVCDANYLQEIEKHFLDFPEKDGCVIYFEHPLTGSEFGPEVYKAAVLYELHLRYYVESIRYTGYPNAFHTVGSCFAVKADAYCRQGGMNKRKAGEDFYFLQKYFEIGTINELNTTRVIPSPRPSVRVPFGTGAAISRLVKDRGETILTYHPDSFEVLKVFFGKITELYQNKDNEKASFLLGGISDELNDFLNICGFVSVLSEIRQNSASLPMFAKRFFRWFNLFRVLKFLNYSKRYFPDVPVCFAATELLRKTGISVSGAGDPEELLEIYRKWERGR